VISAFYFSNFEVDILTVGNLEIEILTVINFEVGILTVGKFEVDQTTWHQKGASCVHRHRLGLPAAHILFFMSTLTV
jgi:hypothetical protein